MKDIPRAARVCITLYGQYTKKEDEKQDVPLGWINVQLIDYKHQLRTGLMSLPMWPDEEANVIGTCVANNTINSNPATLCIP
jgi:hypothetical protein